MRQSPALVIDRTGLLWERHTIASVKLMQSPNRGQLLLIALAGRSAVFLNGRTRH